MTVTREEINEVRKSVHLIQGGLAVAIFLITFLGVSIFTGFLGASAGEPGKEGVGAPVGTIVAWMGDYDEKTGQVIMENDTESIWIVCQGRDFDSSWNREALKIALGENAAKLPDLRGYFLRGHDKDNRVDPGPRSPNKVGGIQKAEVGKHNHTVGGPIMSNVNVTWEPNTKFRDHMLRKDPDGHIQITTDDYGGMETRPKNISVNWIIRVK